MKLEADTLLLSLQDDVLQVTLIPSLIDQNRCAQSLIPMDMMRQG